MALKTTKILIFFSALFIFSLSFACNNNEIMNDPEIVIQGKEENNPPPGLPPGIPSYPYIFDGTFYLNGEKGKNNSKIKSMLGNLDSPVVISSNSEFRNLIIGPRNNEDIKNNIEFYLLLDNGEIVKANEEIPFKVVDKITNVKIQLNFEK